MKTMFTLSKRAAWALMIACFSVLSLATSCTKDNPEPEPIPTGDVKVQYVNAFSGSTAQEFYVNNTRLGTQTAIYGQASGYATTNTANYLYAFKDAGSTTSTTANASVPVQLEIGASYTFYYFRSSTGGKAAAVLNDNTSAPASGKAKVRFVHLNSLIANAVPLTINAQGNATALVTGFVSNTNTDYYEVDATTKFTVTGLAGPITFNDLTLASGKIYTLWLGGTTSTEVTGNLVLQN